MLVKSFDANRVVYQVDEKKSLMGLECRKDEVLTNQILPCVGTLKMFIDCEPH
jgi:hypothetical protein